MEGFTYMLPDGSASVTKKVTLIPERKEVAIHNHTATVVTRFLSEPALLSHKMPPSDPTCTTHPQWLKEATVIGYGEFLGFKVVKLLLTDYPRHREELWQAPDLRCRALYTKLEVKNASAGVYEVNEQIATSVTLGEPSSALFAVPAQFTERSPSELMREAAKRNTGNDLLPPETPNKAQRLDKAYNESKALAPK